MIDAIGQRNGVVRVVDDDEGVRESSRAYLTAVGCEVETYASGDELFARADLGHGGCVLLDLQMPGLSGLQVLERLRLEYPQVAVVMVTGHGDITTAVTAMKAGATDFLEKPYAAKALLAAINRALVAAADHLPEVRARNAKARLATLSPRECQVLSALVAGSSGETIGCAPGLSPRTVEMHRANMMDKLGVRSLSEALRIAYDAGIAAPASAS